MEDFRCERCGQPGISDREGEWLCQNCQDNANEAAYDRQRMTEQNLSYLAEINEVSVLRDQNEQLLAALQAVIEWYSVTPVDVDWSPCMIQAAAAVASAERPAATEPATQEDKS